jgi:hypothetical protein
MEAHFGWKITIALIIRMFTDNSAHLPGTFQVLELEIDMLFDFLNTKRAGMIRIFSRKKAFRTKVGLSKCHFPCITDWGCFRWWRLHQPLSLIEDDEGVLKCASFLFSPVIWGLFVIIA